MEFNIFILILLSVAFAVSGQGYYGEHAGVRRTGRIPGWCPRGSPVIRCIRNPCHGDTSSGCPNYPNAVCINDNPCEPWCIGHYYIGRQRRLTRQECFGETTTVASPESSERPSNCRSLGLRCFANPCDIETCPTYPNAICINDNPCEPYCIGHFYDENRRLTRRQCRRRRRTGRRYWAICQQSNIWWYIEISYSINSCSSQRPLHFIRRETFKENW